MNKAPIEYEDLKAAIAKLGGQKAVANRFDIPYRTVQNWYRGERTPPEYVARMIIQFNEEEFDHVIDQMYNGDIISELKQKNKDLSETNIKMKEWYEIQLEEAKKTIVTQREEINLLNRSIQQQEEEALTFKKLWERAKQELAIHNKKKH